MNKDEFRKKLKQLDLSLKDFSEVSNTSYSTIRNWGYKLKKEDKELVPIPGWVEAFLKYYEISLKIK